ncbi:MAG: FAD-binding oxidoreductase [Pseudomonadales bacterium]|nr:FAD-binding oxidoreductase [Pseudomonadales bacterium]
MSEDLGSFDVVVVGGGIAGVAVAGELAPSARVLVLEREAQPAYHASGRSAAIYIEPYSSDPIFALTMATLPFLRSPPDGFTEVPLCHHRGYLLLSPVGAEADVDDYLARWQPRCTAIAEVSMDEAHRRLPVLREGFATRAVYDDNALALDTNEMIQGWLRRLRAHGGVFRGGAEVTSVVRDGGRYRIESSAGTAQADTVVNAAGGWAEGLGRMAGASPLAFVPKRRSAVLVDAPPGQDISAWPAVSSLRKSFYFKPEGGALMISPADETPVVAADVRPEEMDLAIAVDRAEECADLRVRKFLATWAGLRTFAPDDVPVFGFDPALPGFYWCAGQGGTGFQTADAAARWCAAEILARPLPQDVQDRGLSRASVAPERFL